MSADSFHSQIEKGIKEKKKLQDFLDLVDVVNEKGEALVLKFDDFYQVKKQLSTAKFTADEPYLDDVQVARFQRGSVKLFWKQPYDAKDFKSASFLQKKAEKSVKTLFPPVEKPRGINTAKKQNIAEKLYVHLDQNRRMIYQRICRLNVIRQK